MKIFLFKAVAFLMLQALIFFPLWRPDLPYEHDYLTATIDKHKRLKSIPSSRLILVGGSNLAFGIKSETLETALGLPLVNMGLHINLGAPFMLGEVLGSVRRGDVVVLSFEYEIFVPKAADLLRAQLLERRPASVTAIPSSKWKELCDQYGLCILGGLARRTIVNRFNEEDLGTGSTYRRDLFDPQGSYVGHYGKPSEKFSDAPDNLVLIPPGDLALITEFVRTCQERGALCFFSCPPHPLSLVTPVPAILEKNLETLREVPGLVLIDSPQEQGYERELFYDSTYHLTEAGATQRTEKLVRALKSALQEQFPNARYAALR